MRPLPGRLVLLGHPVAHSLSPRMHNAALQAIGSDLRYEAIDVAPEALDALLDALIAEGAAGNVTIPHKTRVADRCASLTSRARRAGAVNVFWIEAGALAGDNTDIPAFAWLVEQTLGSLPQDARIAMLGAGGAAKAALAAIEQWDGCSVTLYSRTRQHAESLASRFAVVDRIAASPREAVASAWLVVNATPLGLREGDPMPVDPECLGAHSAVIDLVYREGGTEWARAALAAGHRARDGIGMLLEQGALAFEQWMGVAAPRQVMHEALVRRASGSAP
ncbi:MAG TPA: shikimate dehydrogenase [Gemmatimonadaceae bacterium]|nr:shikimate dehydrogenase [Gemmatimonadaceae bacterium]